MRNNHIDRTLRMEAGECSESSWSSKPVQAPASPCLASSLVIPSNVSRGPPIVSVLSLRRRLAEGTGDSRVLSRQDYPVNNASNSLRRSVLHYCKTFTEPFPVGVLSCLFGFFDGITSFGVKKERERKRTVAFSMK